MHQLGAHGIGEAANGRFGSAIGRLQGDRAPGQRRSSLNNHPPIPGGHHLQRRAGAVDIAEIGHLRHPAKFVVAHLTKGRQHGGHGVVDPDVYGTEGGFHLGGGALHSPGIGNIGANRQRFDAKPFAGLLRLLQTRFIAGDQRHVIPCAGETQRGGFSCPGGSAGNNHHGHSDLIHFFAIANLSCMDRIIIKHK